jgi:hypothetical protein
LTDPCNPLKTNEEIIKDIAIGVCNKGNDLENLATIDEILKIVSEHGNINLESENFYSELSQLDCEEWKPPCWARVLGENKDKAKWFDDWCEKFKDFSFHYFESRGWTGTFDSQGLFPDEEWRYVIDPTNENYVIDMRHFLFVGFYLEQKTGVGNFAGDAIEIGQFLKGYQSGLNWQDYFSNRLGVSFSDWLLKNKKTKDIETENFSSLICEFLDSPIALNQRPLLNPQNCK